MQAFANENDPLIWEIISAIVADLKIFFPPKSKEKHRFMKFVRDFSYPQYQRLDIKARAGEPIDDTKLRPIIMGMMHYAADEEYIEAVDEPYGNIYVEKLDQNLRGVIAGTLVRKHPELSIKYFGIYRYSNDSALKRDLMYALAAVRDREIAIKYLDKLKDGTVRPQDRHIFYLCLLRNYKVRSEAFQWAYDNWDWLYEQEGDKTIPDYPRYMAYYAQKEEDVAKFKAFFEPRKRETILARDVAVAFAEIDARMKLINSDKQAIYEYLGF